jgi:hypothetical protein
MSDSTKTKRKKTKRRAIIYKAIHIKLKIEQYVLTGSELWCSGRVGNSCSSSCIRRVTLLQTR